MMVQIIEYLSAMNSYSPFKGKTGVKRVLNATQYSLAGFKSAFIHEAAFRQIVLINVVLIPGSFFLDVTAVEQALMVTGFDCGIIEFSD